MYYNICLYVFVLICFLPVKYARNSLYECCVLSQNFKSKYYKLGQCIDRGCKAALHWLKRGVAVHPHVKFQDYSKYTF